MFSLICAGINGWVNNREAGDLGRYRAHYDVTVMLGVASKVLFNVLRATLTIVLLGPKIGRRF